jgi:hypothetical protein
LNPPNLLNISANLSLSTIYQPSRNLLPAPHFLKTTFQIPYHSLQQSPTSSRLGTDSGPLATGPWTIINHFTSDVTTDDVMIVDEEEDPPAAPAAPFDFTIQVQLNPILGVPALVQTLPPTLLFRDHDERPDWLIRSTNELLHPTPYYMCLNKVMDLFFAQEARLGYPDKVSPLWLSLFIAH